MDEQFAQTLKHLRLWGVVTHWEEYVALAEQADGSPLRFLRQVLEQESRRHTENASRLTSAPGENSGAVADGNFPLRAAAPS